MSERTPIVLASVLNKIEPPLIDFAGPLFEAGWNIWGSRGTAAHLNEHGVSATDVAIVTGVGPMLDHAVVTLHPKIHAGLLADENNSTHMAELKQAGASIIDAVCVDLYDVVGAIARYNNGEATFNDVVKSIDIGGVTILRAAAKGNRIVLSDPSDRPAVVEAITRFGYVDNELRARLRRQAFVTTYEYEAAITQFFQAVG